MNKKIKSVFISRTKLGEACLEKLITRGHKPEAVFSLKDDYRKVIGDLSSFDEICKKENIPLYKLDDIRFWKRIYGANHKPSLLRSTENIKLITSYAPDVCWLFGWGEIITENLLEIPRIGWIGTHPTLLPKYRGGAPLVWPIIKGHEKTGVTFIWLNKGLDEGDILAQKEYSIEENDTAVEIYKKMIHNYLLILENVLSSLEKKQIIRIPQDPDQFIEKWPIRNPEDSRIKWEKPKDKRTLLNYIHDQIRAVSGIYPYAFIDITNQIDYEHAKKLIPEFKDFEHTKNKRLLLKKSLYYTGKDKLEITAYEIIDKPQI